MAKNIHDRLKGCLVLGAVGDALGSYHESKSVHRPFSFENISGITDDTQLTLATCESVLEQQKVSPSDIAQSFLKWYNQRRLVGLGSSTLKALRDLQVGAHWALSGGPENMLRETGLPCGLRRWPFSWMYPTKEP